MNEILPSPETCPVNSSEDNPQGLGLVGVVVTGRTGDELVTLHKPSAQRTLAVLSCSILISLMGLQLSAACAARSARGGLSRPQRLAVDDVLALERSLHTALARGDRQRQERLLADDYLFVTAFGEVLNKTAALEHRPYDDLVSTLDDVQFRVSDHADMVVLLMRITTLSFLPQRRVQVSRLTRVGTRLNGEWRACLGQQTFLDPREGRSVMFGDTRGVAARAD